MRSLLLLRRVTGWRLDGGSGSFDDLSSRGRTTISEQARIMRRRGAPMETVPRDPDPALWSAVADLPRRQREVVVLRYVTDLPVAEIADALGITQGGASASLTKARRRLAKSLDVDAEESRS